MNKPMTVAREEFNSSLASLINENLKDLPAFAIAEVMEKTLDQVKTLAQNQYMNDLEQYEESMKTQNEEE